MIQEASQNLRRPGSWASALAGFAMMGGGVALGALLPPIEAFTWGDTIYTASGLTFGGGLLLVVSILGGSVIRPLFGQIIGAIVAVRGGNVSQIPPELMGSEKPQEFEESKPVEKQSEVKP